MRTITADVSIHALLPVLRQNALAVDAMGSHDGPAAATAVSSDVTICCTRFSRGQPGGSPR